MNPFATDQSQAISGLGESKLIEQLRSWLGEAAPPAPFGMGDDCAVLPASAAGVQQLVTADPIIYGKHFDDRISPEQAAIKLMRRNLSDIAAMGGRPTHAVVSLALDPNVSVSWIERFYRSLAAEANAHGTKIVGGDVSSSDNFIGAFLTLYGETLTNHAPLLRRSSERGSPIFVTGTLGGTRIQKHHSFTPRLKEGQWLAASGECLSCSDLSDGIGKDFANIISDTLACEIDCCLIPISDDAKITSRESGKSPLYHAFNDGEDFELLFTTRPEIDASNFMSQWAATFSTPISRIGSIVARPTTGAPALILKEAPDGFDANGYEHLR